MLYKILHKLFGWDYIYWTNSIDTELARVHVDGLDRPYYLQYNRYLHIISNPGQVIWLTCRPEKYLKLHLNPPTLSDII